MQYTACTRNGYLGATRRPLSIWQLQAAAKQSIVVAEVTMPPQCRFCSTSLFWAFCTDKDCAHRHGTWRRVLTPSRRSGPIFRVCMARHDYPLARQLWALRLAFRRATDAHFACADLATSQGPATMPSSSASSRCTRCCRRRCFQRHHCRRGRTGRPTPAKGPNCSRERCAQ